ncbi:MAG: hypothetical protein QM656_16585 [Paracoccaceae bacterium]
MIPPLRSLMVTLWVSCIAGVVVIAGLALGMVNWQLFAIAAVIGLVTGFPAGLWTARTLRRGNYHLQANGRTA